MVTDILKAYQQVLSLDSCCEGQQPIFTALEIVNNSTLRATGDVLKPFTAGELSSMAQCITNRVFEPDQPVELDFPSFRKLLHGVDNESFCRMFARDFFGETLHRFLGKPTSFDCLLFSFTLMNTIGFDEDRYIGAEVPFEFMKASMSAGIDHRDLIDAMLLLFETMT